MNKLWNLVLEGGGAKGIALLGPIQAAENRGLVFKRMVGTSAGAIVASLYAAGYNYKELEALLMKTNFESLLDPYWPKWYGLVRHWGMHKGDKLYKWIYEYLSHKKIYRFSDLKMELYVVVSDVTHNQKLVISKSNWPGMLVADAVRMSASIPIFFAPKYLGEALVVDGGLLSNYAVSVCLDEIDQTFGIKLVTDGAPVVPIAPRSAWDYLNGLLLTMLQAHDHEVYAHSFHDRTIHVPTGGVGTYGFALSVDQKLALLKGGYDTAWEFFPISSRHVPPL